MSHPENGAPGGTPQTAAAGGLILHYEEIARASRSMLEAAHRDDWAAVELLEARCRELIEALKRATTPGGLAVQERQRRITLLRGILQDDAQIRLRAEPWLRDLESILGTAPSPA
jgi:flagellar protein FliT